MPLGFTNKGPVTFASGTTLETAGKSWLGALYTHALWSDGFGDSKSTLCNLCQVFTNFILIASTYPSVHGVAASHVIRNNRDSVLNTDSNKFFSIALMLDGLFWGSGVGQTSQQEYASLQKTAAGKKLIAAFGLTNIPVPARGITWASGWVPPNMNNEVVPMQPIPTA